MSSSAATAGSGGPDSRPHWVVEVNIAGLRVMRRAEKRRYLLSINPLIFLPRRPSEAL